MSIRVVVADDQELVRTGFVMILDAQPDIEVVGEASDGLEAIAAAHEHRPDVLLIDIRMPGLDGIAAARAICAATSSRVIMLTTFEQDDYVFDALAAGASGYLLKDLRRDDLVRAVRVVAAGEALIAPSVTRRLIEAVVFRKGVPALPGRSPSVLTPRETEMLVLLGRGLSNAEMAAHLVVSEHTVKTHVSSVLAKLHLRDRAQAAISAYELGLVVPGEGGQSASPLGPGRIPWTPRQLPTAGTSPSRCPSCHRSFPTSSEVRTPMARTTPAPLPRETTTVLRTLTVAAFVVILNETLLVNALPQLMESLQVDERAVQWLTTGFMLTLAVVIPTTGWLLQRLGTRSAFRLAMGLFLTGTLACALAPSFPLLLVGRVVQASGTAIMMPLLMTTLLGLVPPGARGRVMGNVTLTIAVAPAMGPAVSGVILRWLSWHWLFLLVLPIALVVTLVGLRALRVAQVPDPDGPRPGLDGISVVLTALGFGSLIYGLAEAGGEAGAASPLVPAPLALGVGAVGLALFVWRQLALQRSGEPLLDLRVVLHGQFTAALVLTSIAFMALMGVMILLPLYLQEVRGLTVLQAGLLLMPGGLVMGLMGPVVGRWFDRVGSRPLVIPGAVILLLSLGGMTAATLGAPWWAFLICHVTASIGLALMFTPAFTGGLGSLPSHLYPYGSAMLGTIQQVAAAAGTAVSIAVLSWRQGWLTGEGASPVEALDGGVRAALMVGLALAVVVVLLSTLVNSRPEDDAAAGAGAEPAPAEGEPSGAPERAAYPTA